MRRDAGWPRGEAGRVAERVRAVVFDEPTPPPESTAERGPRHAGGRELLDRLLARVPVRVDPGRRAALGIGVAVLVTALATGLWLLSQRPRALAVSASAPALASAATLAPTGSASSSGPSAGATSASGRSATPGAGPGGSADIVVVHVAGRVRRPGLYRLPAGSRVDDALRSAGGALRGVDLSRLNLAAKLIDGEQIPVGLPGAAAAPGGPAASPAGPGAAGSASTGPVDLNTAGLEQLDSLPGVGPVLAQHILDWRGQHGRFDTVDQLNDVPGIGDVKFGELKTLVSV